MPTAFISQEVTQHGKRLMPNFKPAEKFGSIAFVFSKTDRPSLMPVEAMEKARLAMKEYDYRHDYLIYPAMGEVAAFFAMVMVAMEKKPKFIQILVWRKMPYSEDPSEGDYQPVILPVQFKKGR